MLVTANFPSLDVVAALVLALRHRSAPDPDREAVVNVHVVG
jgi:hypothetical protein